VTDLELAVRTIENILPDMPTKAIQKWLGILNTAAVKCEQELASTMMHRCGVCGTEEYGYRTEMPVGWREKGDLVICFNHEDNEIAELLAKAVEADKPEPVDTEQTLEELLAIL
jgi:hypothetical protein